ncbi:hypothetical protein DJ252_18475 [Salmonella enterica subsp. enterica serovar Uzaramo]|uniref:Uncharacterized protein n=1 Tax=Salmonella enterica TaxID=28901 RepID=A0A759WCI4_SALER|nr:hypothetical protein [Salmonella enterica]EEE9946934.1 hypothetical protein [Salmonella enterica subsp. enterica serovar Uzaramo]EIM5531732.1 hypothetical protein [Salmonella enterica subsp. enterica]ELD8107750.1 hypothetical protein [Salmonella enterica subsp. enterica serovar Benin]EBB6483898.1 hypothetical protein [Salmonella enterica]
MASIAITDRFMRISGISDNIPKDYWMGVIKKVNACGFGISGETETPDTYFLEIAFTDKKHTENAIAGILSACELVNIEVSNKDDIPNSEDKYPYMGEFRGLTESSQQAARDVLKCILCQEYKFLNDKSHYGHLVREAFMQLESNRLHPVGIYNGEKRTPL